MQIKLSTLLIIIGLLYVGYHYLVEQQRVPHYAPMPEPRPVAGPPVVIDEPTTAIIDVGPMRPPQQAPMPMHVPVTPLEPAMINQPNAYDPHHSYELAGNVRPDNVMYYDD